MATKYKTTVSVCLVPRWHADPPEIIISAGDHSQRLALSQEQTFDFVFESLPGDILLSVELLNKKDSDTVSEKNLDKAVIIDSITINGITDPRFIWCGQYRPRYPEPWYSEQPAKPLSILSNQNYLGWNGVWSIKIGVPSFTWMHQLLGLGWVFE